MQLECVTLTIESSCADISAGTGSGCTYNSDYVWCLRTLWKRDACCAVNTVRYRFCINLGLSPLVSKEPAMFKKDAQKKKKQKKGIKRGKQQGFHSAQIKVENPQD